MASNILIQIKPYKTLTSNICLTVFMSGDTNGMLKYLIEQKKDANNIKNAFKSKLVKNILTEMILHVEDKLLLGNIVIFGCKEEIAHFSLPYKVDESKYYCDDHFRIDIIKDKVDPAPKLGILVVQPKKATFYHFMPSNIKVVKKINKKSDSTFWQDIKKGLELYFEQPSHVFGGILVGSATLLKHLSDIEYINVVSVKPIAEMKTELIEIFLREKFKKIVVHLEEIFAQLDGPKIVYGLRDVTTALEYQQLEILYTTKNLSENIDTGNCKVIKIPSKLTTIYEKLNAMGGVIGWKYY